MQVPPLLKSSWIGIMMVAAADPGASRDDHGQQIAPDENGDKRIFLNRVPKLPFLLGSNIAE